MSPFNYSRLCALCADEYDGRVPKGQHTPGPWDFNTQYHGLHSIPFQSERPVRAVMSPTGDVAYIANWHNDADERAANARLIAAAPELADALRVALAALEEIAEHGAGLDTFNDCSDGYGFSAACAARAALAKLD